MKLTIGTRGSPLALWQARYVAAEIEKNRPGTRVDLLTIKTRGDKILDTPLAVIGTKGLFTKEIEDALLDGRVDLAVHSMKDLPTELPEGLHLAATMRREDPRDVFVSRDGRGLRDLAEGSRIGTSSLRRRAFLLNRYPGLEVVPLRGNVDTRLRKIESENLSGVILAAAGMIRTGFGDRITSHMEPEEMIPAIGQGALAIETRVDDPATHSVTADLDHAQTARCVAVERAFLRRMGGGCQVPMAAHCTAKDDSIVVTAAVVHPDGIPMVADRYEGPDEGPSVGSHLADRLIGQGAGEILRSVLGDDWAPGAVTTEE
ncbi:MAG: hydroxymethylbilane synthase [Desulfomonilaceae bacterium]|nr:hydroxymethylbilane synthase [Desulfomonilaceae bacterium]